MSHPRRETLVLLAVLLAGLALRVWYASDSGRFPDEKYALRNVESLLETHTLQPASVYYPSPVFFVPPAALLKATEALTEVTGIPLPAVWTRGRLSAAAVLLCRLLQVVYGAVSLLLLYLLGSALFSPRVGLLAAAMLAFMPLHIRASAYFKPDAQLVLTVLAAFLVSLWALRGRGLARYLLAGGMIALAMSGKLLGAAVSVPLALGTLLQLEASRRRRWASLTLAAVAAGGFFVLLNPYWRFYLKWLHGLQIDYARRASAAAATRPEIPLRFVQSVVDDTIHGPWIGAAAVAGLTWLTLTVLRAGIGSPESRERLMLLAYPLCFITVFTLSTPYFKANNFLSVLPFTALAAAWAIDQGLVWLGDQGGARRWRWARATVMSALIALVAVPGTLFTYRSRTPTTREAAERVLLRGLQPRLGRMLIVETTDARPVAWRRPKSPGDGLMAVLEVEDLTLFSTRRIDGSDGLLFREEQLEGDRAAFFRRLVRPRQGRVIRTIRPSLFRLRGPAVVAVQDRWRSCGHSGLLEASWVDAARQYVVRLPENGSKSLAVTLSLWVPRRIPWRHSAWSRELRIGNRRVPLFWVSLLADRQLFASERLPWPASKSEVVVTLRSPPGRRGGMEAVASFWQRPAGPATERCTPHRSVSNPGHR